MSSTASADVARSRWLQARRGLCLALQLAILAHAASASAQLPTDSPANEPGRAAPRSSVSATSPQQPPSAASPDPAAQAAVQRGEILFDAQNYDAALTEFSAAYTRLAADPRRYLLLNNIAVCHERMFRYDLALRYYERYLAEGGEQAVDRAEVQGIVRTLRGLLARLVVDVNVSAELWIDQRAVGQVPGEFLVPAGKHLIELRASLYEPKRREVQLAARSLQRIEFKLEHLSQFEGIHPAYFWVSLGCTAGALTLASVSGLSAIAAHSAAEQRASENRLFNTVDDESSIRRKALTADLSLAGAALLGATSVLLYFLTAWHADARSDAPAPSALRGPAVATQRGARPEGYE
jgi:tetratricopeptide (TPR) repeat protein